MSLIAPRRSPLRLLAGIGLLLLLVAGLATFQLLRPVPALTAQALVSTAAASPATAPSLPWPAKGAGAVAVTDLGLLGVGGSTVPQPMFSVAKIMTALVILEDRPLKPGETGPTITVDASDVAIYQARQAAGESVVKVVAGEQLTEYQALQGLLIPSGNNIGVLLARWDVGSEAALVARLNARAAALHLDGTKFDDVSGASVKTVSVPSELAVLGGLAIKEPLIASIVSQVQAQLPVAGVVYNVDYVLGQEGIIGIKTGSSPDGGANFVFAATHTVEGRPVTIYGAIMGLGTLDEAFSATRALIKAVRPGLGLRHVLTAQQVVARYQAPWKRHTDVVAQQPLDVLTWPGIPVRTHLETRPLNAPVPAGNRVGLFSVRAGDQVLQTELITTDALTRPPTRYRLTRTDF
ncbi:MAG: D-alanyl-D-alanine carboxypeptidase family protein [Candidatus Dormibacteria bacterium]